MMSKAIEFAAMLLAFIMVVGSIDSDAMTSEESTESRLHARGQ
jgi:hypothetical protein